MNITEEQAREIFRHEQAWKSIRYISWYCHLSQSCNKCTIKEWCKNKRKKCPEEWRSKICQEIDTQVVDQDKKN